MLTIGQLLMTLKIKKFEQCATMINSIARELACPERWPLLDGCANLMREAAQGNARYEVLRVMNPKEFAELWARSLLGERFDDMVDELVKAKNELR